MDLVPKGENNKESRRLLLLLPQNINRHQQQASPVKCVAAVVYSYLWLLELRHFTLDHAELLKSGHGQGTYVLGQLKKKRKGFSPEIGIYTYSIF